MFFSVHKNKTLVGIETSTYSEFKHTTLSILLKDGRTIYLGCEVDIKGRKGIIVRFVEQWEMFEGSNPKPEDFVAVAFFDTHYGADDEFFYVNPLNFTIVDN